MKESAIQKQILNYLNGLPNCYAVTNHGSAWQGAGRPDIFACFRGQFLALEVKTKDGYLTRLQQHELSKWNIAGAKAGVVSSVKDVKVMIGIKE